jgi:hypothetical protein
LSAATITTIALVACCSRKGSQVGPARDVYRSPLFRMSLAYAEHVLFASHTFILSAKYGAIAPDRVIEPYDLALSDFEDWEHADWAHVVGIQLRDALGLSFTASCPPRWRWVLLASELYRPDLPTGAQVEVPLAGMQIGQRLSFLKTGLGVVPRELWAGRAA